MPIGKGPDAAVFDQGRALIFSSNGQDGTLTVIHEDEDSGKTVTYQIVGEDEADIKLGLVNIGSPIARALIGKEEGDSAEVQAPGGVRRYEVVTVSYV